MNRIFILVFVLLSVSVPLIAQNVGSVSGVVTTEGGEAIAEARVMMTSRGQVPVRGETDENGGFNFDEVVAGDWALIVSAIGYFNFQDDIVVEADQAVELEIQLESIWGDDEEDETGSVSGFVNTEEGEAIAEARVMMTSRGQVPVRGESDENGGFNFDEVVVGEWELIVSARGFFNFRDDIVIEADQAVELAIQLESIWGDDDEDETGSVSGVVSNEEGEAIPEARVMMTSRGQVPVRGETDENGGFSFDEVVAGEWDLIVSARGFFNFRDDVVVEVDQAVELEIQLESIWGEDGEGGPDDIMGNVLHYLPYQSVLSIPVDTPQEFEIFPFDPEETWLTYLWKFDGNYIDDFSWTMINFKETGKYQVTVYISDATETDSLTWEINVVPTSVPGNNDGLLPSVPVLYSAAPNPFNSTTSISYVLTNASNISLDLFNLSGQLVNSMDKGYKQAGVYSAPLTADNLPSGLYFIRLMVSGQVLTQKVTLIR